MVRSFLTLPVAVLAISTASALQLSVKTSDTTRTSASALADNLMSYGLTDGVLPSPYWWWESAGLLNSMVHYSHYTQDYTYDETVANAIAAQAGTGNDFMGAQTLGNDDQLWWGLLALTAAEYNFRQPASGSSYLQLAENVYNEVLGRWDSATCGGGLRWQITTDASNTYKNAVSNALFFQLAARLARYTGDSKYSDEATNVWNWVSSVGIIDKANYNVYDGTSTNDGCTSLDHDQWSYNAGAFLYGAAVMLDITGDSGTWQPRVSGLLGGVANAFSADNVLQEKCEADGSCDVDQKSFKAYTSRWLAATAAMVPSVAAQIQPLLDESVNGAVQACVADADGNNDGVCGLKWTTNGDDQDYGVGQQLAALEIVQGQLASGRPLPAKVGAAKRTVARSFVA